LTLSSQSQPSSSLQYDATLSDKTFAELYDGLLPDWLLENCKENGFERPTLIQQRALDSFFSDDSNSMVIQAQTGSGKTLTYLLPLLSKLENRASVQAMIVVPTRELGLQVATVVKRLVARRFMVMSLLQGSQLKRQRAWAWAETPQVVIGTPTELLDMVQFGGLPRINSIKTVVVDEVDACLVHQSGTSLQGRGGRSKGDSRTLSSSLHPLLSKFLSPTYADEGDIEDDDVIILADDTSKKRRRKVRHRQTIFCSATIPQHRYFLKQCKANQWTLEEPEYVCTSPGEALPPTLQHAYMVCQSKTKKMATLRNIVKKLASPTNKVLVFFDSSRPLEVIGKKVAGVFENGIVYEERKTELDDIGAKPVVSILRYEDSLSQRAGATKAFTEGSDFRVMVTTDLAARGLDMVGVSHIVHFDLPSDADTYLHRSGRAGRLGNKGQVITILTNDQEFVLNRLTNELGIDAKCVGRQKEKKASSR
jgi:superfamily II DNA/RNA helicase